jgi:hypothetical protein
MELFHKIEVATTKNQPFYSNMYYLFSVQPADAQLQKILDFDTVVLVDADKFFARDYIQFFEKCSARECRHAKIYHFNLFEGRKIPPAFAVQVGFEIRYERRG